MTITTRHTRQVDSLIAAFCRGIAKPITPLEEMTIYLESALRCARDTSKTEADRMRELRTRVSLMPLSGD